MASHQDRNSRRILGQYGPWALVTGASSGIGREFATQLAAAGFHLVIVSRREDSLHSLAAELKTVHQIECRPIAMDLGKTDAVGELMNCIEGLEINLVVASAGFGSAGPFVTSELAAEVDMLQLNCRSLMELSWHFGKRFSAQRRGGIVLLSSIVAFQGTPWSANYSATKAYVQNLAEGLAVELSGSGVDVLAVCPGPTATGFSDRAHMKMGKAASPADVVGPSLKALGRKSTILPGFLAKLLTYSLATLPRWAKVKIMGKVMQGMASR